MHFLYSHVSDKLFIKLQDTMYVLKSCVICKIYDINNNSILQSFNTLDIHKRFSCLKFHLFSFYFL